MALQGDLADCVQGRVAIRDSRYHQLLVGPGTCVRPLPRWTMLSERLLAGPVGGSVVGERREVLDLPPGVDAVLRSFLCCELSTVAADGTPLAWPTVPLYLPDRGQLLVTTSIGFPVKALNIAREPRVSLLFSDATGSGLQRPPAVLLQGQGRVVDGLSSWTPDLAAHWQRVRTVQPASAWFSRTPPARWFLDWYFMRLLIYVDPVRVLWWPDAETSRAPQQWAGPGAR